MKSEKLHQVLHGYKGGHGRIAGSIKLSERDSETIARLSDLSGSLSSGVRISPYLTGYPLPSKQFFALARTWPDHEAPRTGCVLTHTILVPLETWGSLPRVRLIGMLFQTPFSNTKHDFNEPIDFDRMMDAVPPPISEPLQKAAIKSFVARYFGRGIKPIVWFDAKEAEEYMWRLFDHLWPQLRRVFSCCTFALQQRSLEDGPFDLLFAPSAVQSRFVKLTPDHLIDSGLRPDDDPLEPWCEYWAEALFSAQSGLPAKEAELPAWNELGEDPTALRKLSLIQELRMRSAQSATAGVGAVDVVESLALEPSSALPLKKIVLSSAISAALSSDNAGDAFMSLRLIDDRLHREPFRKVSEEFKQQLCAATTKRTVKNPEAAIDAKDSWLSDSVAGIEDPFVNGILHGLREVASSNPSRLGAIGSHPEIAAEIFKREPSFAGTYLKIGGDSAAETVAEWLASSRDVDVLRIARQAALPLKETAASERLVSLLIQDLPEDEVPDALAVLARVADEFADDRLRAIVAQEICSVHPDTVRQWAASLPNWSKGIAKLVAATYPINRDSFSKLFEDSRFNEQRQAEVVASLICTQTPGSWPYWMREFIADDSRVISALIRQRSWDSELVATALEDMLSEVPDVPLARVPNVVTEVLNFEGHGIFDKLFDAAMRSALSEYLHDGGSSVLNDFAGTQNGAQWFESVSSQSLTRILSKACRSGTESVARAWEWIASAPTSLYSRYSVLSEISDQILRYLRHPFPQGAEWSMVKVLSRSKNEASYELHSELSSKMLRFAFDNIRFPLGCVVAESFPNVYQAALRDKGGSPSLFALFFGSYNWDRAKDLRVAIIDTFLRSQWRPGDLALAADDAGILRKIFKRLHRKYNGDAYIRAMLEDLKQRSDSRSPQVFASLQSCANDPNFYEEWD